MRERDLQDITNGYFRERGDWEEGIRVTIYSEEIEDYVHEEEHLKREIEDPVSRELWRRAEGHVEHRGEARVCVQKQHEKVEEALPLRFLSNSDALLAGRFLSLAFQEVFCVLS